MDIEIDHFAKDREMLQKSANELQDITVRIGEWSADNVLGDPNLGNALNYCGAAEGALRAAWLLVNVAIDKLPEAPDA